MAETENANAMETHAYDIQVRALIYKEDGRFYARSLEMDLLGTGATGAKALRQLQELVEEHVSFALFMKDESLILFKAEKEYFDRWEQAVITQLRNELFPDKAVDMKYTAQFIYITKQELAKLKRKSHFNPVLEQQCA
jgi:hypothetical protein